MLKILGKFGRNPDVAQSGAIAETDLPWYLNYTSETTHYRSGFLACASLTSLLKYLPGC
ncbi:hypothetical protein BDZ89DRAFT_1070532 [Hymenopellis radicata]|nr:hypothetical protein BDZ89DRAFT_1070532 [Hymenopellis radicata]